MNNTYVNWREQNIARFHASNRAMEISHQVTGAKHSLNLGLSVKSRRYHELFQRDVCPSAKLPIAVGPSLRPVRSQHGAPRLI